MSLKYVLTYEVSVESLKRSYRYIYNNILLSLYRYKTIQKHVADKAGRVQLWDTMTQ